MCYLQQGKSFLAVSSNWQRFHFDRKLFYDFFEWYIQEKKDKFFCNSTWKFNLTFSLQLYYHWFTTGGYPMVKVTKTASSVRVDQLGPGIWPLRLSFTDGSKAWQFGSSYSMPIGAPKKSLHRSSFSPFLLNTNFSSFMRVNYDRRSWDEILRLTCVFDSTLKHLILLKGVE